MEELIENIPDTGDEEDPKTESKVLISFRMAAEQLGVKISREYMSYMKGWPIRLAFETLINKVSPYAKEKEIRQKVEEFYTIFRTVLERQYQVR